MIDPRPAGIAKRLADVERIFAVTGGKGGIGKSLVSSTLALALADSGFRTGLLDLDLTGPSDHLFLGVAAGFPDEEFGVEPSVHHGIRFMSIANFGGDRPAPLRGVESTNALLELLAITRWGGLDSLVIDLPPGLGDTTLDLVRLLERTEYLAVCTPSLVVRETVRRTLRLLGSLEVPVAGLLENMQREPSDTVRTLAERCGVAYVGALPHDPAVDAAAGDVAALRATRFFGAMRPRAADLIRTPAPGR